MIENANELYRFLKENGYLGSRSTVYNQCVFGGKLQPTWVNGDKKGKWDKKKILKIAKNLYDFEGDDSGSMSSYPSPSSHEDKAAGDARLRNLQADRVEFNFNRERGKYVSMTVMFGELAARARVFRLSLEKWGMDRADSIADMFGGGADESRELCEMLGIDPVRFSPVVVEFAQSKSRELVKMWLADVSLLLDAYSYGRFLSPEAQEEFVASEAGAENLLEYVDGEVSALIEGCNEILGNQFREFMAHNAIISSLMERAS